MAKKQTNKQILEEINRKLVDITKVNQWKNTSSVLQWFKQLANKGDSAFICFDVVEFYPSITEALLKRALDFASEHVNISANERQAVINSKHSLLFNKGQPGEKRNSTSNFEVTMGSYDGAETCELVGCYLLSQRKQIPGIEIRTQSNTKADRESKKTNMPNICEQQPENHS